jgi:hypothetical protein
MPKKKPKPQIHGRAKVMRLIGVSGYSRNTLRRLPTRALALTYLDCWGGSAQMGFEASGSALLASCQKKNKCKYISTRVGQNAGRTH